jgi:hypothetical protein
MSMMEQTLIAIILCVILFFLGPRTKKAMQESREAENPDWKGALLPLGMVALFVILLISMARG